MRARPFLALLVLSLLTAGCGHVIRAEFAPNHAGRDVDFRRLPCVPAGRPTETGPDDVLIRYFGAAGLYVEWHGTAILTGPFFSNPGVLKAQFGRLVSDPVRIERGLWGMDLGNVRAILVGHSHYDHLGDVPAVAERAPKAGVYVNQTGANALAGIAGLKGRVDSVEGPLGGDWITLADEQKRALPIRFRPVKSEHAPLLPHYRWHQKEIREPWQTGWDGRRFSELQSGQTFAFVIDLLDEQGQVRFRLYYQDSAAGEGFGVPDFLEPDEPGVDLAVLCMASFRYVENDPASILEALHPRHVLATHYEDFFRDPQKPVRFVPLLTNRAANEFLGRVRSAQHGVKEEAKERPIDPVCGPSNRDATMPLPGEWLRFRARSTP